VPIVARLAGTELDAGLRLLDAAGVPIQRASDLGEAARKAVQAAKG
jgi:succinyl-CoA synthetase beta subunit